MKKIVVTLLLWFSISPVVAQNSVDNEQLGAWYMYFFNKQFKNSQFGIQGDYQFRFWDAGSDLEQLLLRTGLTFRPKSADILFTLGYGHITSGEFGEESNPVYEHRVYQEALFTQKIGTRFLLTHRFRYEQRWVQDQDFRTRYRYNLFMNIPLNDTQLGKGVIYAALYNELFINGEKSIGEGRSVQYFDRNRTYLGFGYGLSKSLRMQLGWMRQTTTGYAKDQAQISLHHIF